MFRKEVLCINQDFPGIESNMDGPKRSKHKSREGSKSWKP
jgi:hypothetical protein